MRTPQRMTTMRLVTCLLGLCMAAGFFLLGRVTVGTGARADSYRTGLTTGYTRGLVTGRSEGVREGRAYQETDALPPATRDKARAAFDSGYRAGANDTFGGYDGGWSFSAPYVITLTQGDTGITYRFASRTPIQAGVDYYLCPHSHRLCQEARN